MNYRLRVSGTRHYTPLCMILVNFYCDYNRRAILQLLNNFLQSSVYIFVYLKIRKFRVKKLVGETK